MKIKNGFVKREVAGNSIVVAIGEAAEKFNGMMKLNDTGSFIWSKLEDGLDRDSIVKSVIEAYDVDEATAVKGVDSFIGELEKIGCVE